MRDQMGVAWFSRMSSAWFLSSSWPPSCLQLPSPHSGASVFACLLRPPLRWRSRPTTSPHPAPFLSASCGVLSKLRRMEAGAAAARYSQLLDCVCSWGQAADILDLTVDWLTQDLPKQGVSPAGSRPGRTLKAFVFGLCVCVSPQENNEGKRKVRIQETVEAKPELALAYLEYLFNHKATREKVLALGERRLKRLHDALGSWRVRGDGGGASRGTLACQPCFKHYLSRQSVLYTHLSRTTAEPGRPSAETALGAFVYHSRLGAHLQHSVSFAHVPAETAAFFFCFFL